MQIKVVWTKKARKNLLDILDFWTENNKSNAYSLKVKSEILKVERVLKFNPRIGVLRIHNGRKVRVFNFLRKFSLLYFLEDEYTIKVIAFISNSFNKDGFS